MFEEMESTITIVPCQGVIVMSIKGRLTVNDLTQVRIKERVRDMLSDGYRKFVFDLSEARYIDAVSLGALILCFNTISWRKGNFTVVDLHKKVSLLIYVKLLTMVNEFYQNSSVAVEAVNGAAA